MVANFDIFMRLPDGQPVWIKAVDTLQEAQRELVQIKANLPAAYFIFNAANGQLLGEGQAETSMHQTV